MPLGRDFTKTSTVYSTIEWGGVLFTDALFAMAQRLRKKGQHTKWYLTRTKLWVKRVNAVIPLATRKRSGGNFVMRTKLKGYQIVSSGGKREVKMVAQVGNIVGRDTS